MNYRCISRIALGTLFSVVCVLTFTLLADAAIWDPTPVAPKVEVSGYTGGYGTHTSIVVPSFHGIEPQIALSYGSSSSNGFVGVGWGISGLSSIVRMGSEDGVPRWDETDQYRLNGQLLVPCGASNSPGCAAGGTHFTEFENYQRITRNGDGSWSVTAKNGTHSIYTLVMGWGAPYEYRWQISRVVDTLGNEVNYSYWCDVDAEDNTLQCYPDTITYNGSTITFYWEQRPDLITFATGRLLGTTQYRLKTIDVSVSDQRVRAYALSYATSDSSNRSLLTSVQEFGTDAIVDAEGTVSGGMSLPATTYAYKHDENFDSFADSTKTDGFCAGITAASGTGDFNGDGLSDVWCHRVYFGGGTYNFVTQVGLSNGDGTFAMQPEFDDRCFDPDKFQTGDFNGDGLTDFLCQIVRPGFSTNVRLNNGDGTFTPYQNWATNWCELTNPWVQFGSADVNGDGKLDVWCHNGWDHHAKVILPVTVGISNGTSFDESVWQENWCWVVDATFTIGADVNGDGKADAICQGNSAGAIEVRLSTGSGLTPSTFSLLSFWCDGAVWAGSRFGAGDFNGDGKTDLWCNRQGSEHAGLNIVYSTGQDWVNYGNVVPRFCQGAVTVTTGDFNGDGRTDIYCKGNNAHLNTFNYVLLSEDDGTFTPTTVWNEGWCNTYIPGGNPNHEAKQVGVGDFNGDGKSDLFCATRSEHAGDLWVSHSGTVKGRLDLVEQVNNGYGGQTDITYVPSSTWDNHPGYSVRPTVNTITTSDGRGWSATTTYTYADGLLNREEGQDLGFGYVSKRLPALENESAGPITESWYRQELATVGLIERSEKRDGNGNLLSSLEYEYDVTGNGETEAYTVHQTGRWSRTFDGSGQECSTWPCEDGVRTYSTFGYDAYQNQIQSVDFGNYDVQGDEMTTIRKIIPNRELYVVDKVASGETLAGTDGNGQRLSHTLYFYDGAAQWDSKPTKGLLTKSLVWLDTDDSYLGDCGSTSCIEYDLYGNVLKTIDALGNATTFHYDDIYHQFLTQSVNALGHTTQSSWDPVCGVVVEQTDVNDHATTYQYDSNCRLTRSDGPLGAFEEISYLHLGDPLSQYTEVQRPGSKDSGSLWTRTYFDGLGRTYRSESKGPAIGREILTSEVTFNQRGSVATTAAPRYAGESPQITKTDYDSRNRVIEVTFPDGATTQTQYELFSVTQIDEEGRKSQTRRSPNGLQETTVEYLNGAAIETVSDNDLLGNPTSIVDDAGNRWTFTYDNLGRKLAIDDPDTGYWTWTYNALGQTKSETNALDEVITYTYDPLGRPSQKSSATGTVRYHYDEAVKGYSNIGRLTSMEDSAGKASQNYDAAGRIVYAVREVDEVPYVTQTEFDAGGRMLSITYPDGDSFTYTYDGAGRQDSISELVESTEYDASGQLISQSLANGMTTHKSYSATRGWLTHIQTASDKATIQDLVYTRDSSSLITGIDSPHPNETWRYTYDALKRLISAENITDPGWDQQFEYNEIGNMTYNSQIGTYTYPDPGHPRPHAVLTAGTNSYTYNANGQMLNGGEQTITWNEDGLPSTIDDISFVYDGDGSRIQKIGKWGDVTTYIGDDYQIDSDGTITKYVGVAKKVTTPAHLIERQIEQEDTEEDSGTTTRPTNPLTTTADLPSIFIPLMAGTNVSTIQSADMSSDDAFSELFWLHTDHLGSIQAITDENGNEVQRQSYAPYGKQALTATKHPESKGWIGERLDDEIGLMYLHARYYDPMLGRFLSPDPIARPGQNLNRYTYGLNDPINMLDPSGLDPTCSGSVSNGRGKVFSFVQSCSHGPTPMNDRGDDPTGLDITSATEPPSERPDNDLPYPFNDPTFGNPWSRYGEIFDEAPINDECHVYPQFCHEEDFAPGEFPRPQPSPGSEPTEEEEGGSTEPCTSATCPDYPWPDWPPLPWPPRDDCSWGWCEDPIPLPPLPPAPPTPPTRNIPNGCKTVNGAEFCVRVIYDVESH